MEEIRCVGITLKGKRCKNNNNGSEFCRTHDPAFKCKFVEGDFRCSKMICKDGFCKFHAKEENCGICLEEMKYNGKLKLCCGHEFCRRCINEWLFLNAKCPMCRKTIQTNETIAAYEYCIVNDIFVCVKKKYYIYGNNFKPTPEAIGLFRHFLLRKYLKIELTEHEFDGLTMDISCLFTENPEKYRDLALLVTKLDYYYKTTFIRNKPNNNSPLVSLEHIV